MFFVILIRNRSGSFTDSALGNTSATSGSRRTTDLPKLLRPGPSPRTCILLRSYSGRSSSFIFGLTFFMGFSLCRGDFSGANRAHRIFSFCVRHNQQRTFPRLAEDKKAMLIIGVVGVVKVHIECIVEKCYCFVKSYSMMRQIGCCFLLIPLEFHTYGITAEIEICSNTFSR